MPPKKGNSKAANKGGKSDDGGEKGMNINIFA